VTHDIFAIIPDGIGVEVSFSLEGMMIGWTQSKTTGENYRENVIARQFNRANNSILAGDDLSLDTTETENNLEMRKQVKAR